MWLSYGLFTFLLVITKNICCYFALFSILKIKLSIASLSASAVTEKSLCHSNTNTVIRYTILSLYILATPHNIRTTLSYAQRYKNYFLKILGTQIYDWNIHILILHWVLSRSYVHHCRCFVVLVELMVMRSAILFIRVQIAEMLVWLLFVIVWVL